MSGYFIIAVAAVIGFAIAAAAFCWPNHVLLRSVVAAVCAWSLPYVATFALGPFLGEGAGLGVALILYFLSGAILLAAISAALGAAARYLWAAIRGSGLPPRR